MENIISLTNALKVSLLLTLFNKKKAPSIKKLKKRKFYIRFESMENNPALKKSFFEFIKDFPVFLSLVLIFIVLGTLLSLNYSQAELFLVINRLHDERLDEVFKMLTHLGDWPATILIAGICMFFQYRYSLVLVANMLYTGLYTQILKVVFKHPRPYVFFENAEPIYTIEDYVLQNSLSFPSGHTTSAFSLMITLSYLVPAQRRKPWFFILAFIVALSRVYLAQHFFKDLIAGALIGTFMALQLLWLFERSQWYHGARLSQKLKF